MRAIYQDIALGIFLLTVTVGLGIAVATTKKKNVRHAGIAGLCVVIAICVSGLILINVARGHGATNENLNELTFSEILKNTRNTHAKSNIKDLNNLADCYIIYYRFTCPDCTGTYQALQSWLKANPPDTDLYYISSDSEDGKALLEKFSVKTVPSMLYVYPNGRTYLAEQIYSNSADGATLYPEALDRVYEARKDVISQ